MFETSNQNLIYKFISPIIRVYGGYIYIVNGDYKPTYN